MSTLQKKLRNFFLEARTINFYFLILIFALFLGDGKQAIVDIFLCFCIPVWAAFLFIYRKKIRHLPQPVYLGWWGMILYITVSLFFSASPGLSFTYLVRMLLAFVSFYAFYCYTSYDSVKKFILNLKIFVTFACGLALLLILFPQLSFQIPSMNLFYASFGHNHLSGLILFILPFLVSQLLNKPGKYGIFWLAFILLLLLLSFGRLALGMAICYLIFILIKHFNHISYSKRVSLIFITVILLLSIGLIFINSQKTQTSNFWLNRQINKSFSIFGFRGRYWQQALAAFANQPIFGTGPGTFSLSSKKYQTAPETYSFYAHSFPLEFMSENGIIGALILIWLLLLIFRNIPKFNRQSLIINHDSNTNILFSGVVLVFLYSAVDFSLNFIIIWLLFWSSLAILSIDRSFKQITNNPSASLRTGNQQLTIYICIFILLCFYLTALTSLVISVPENINAKTRAFYLAPYDEIRAKNLLETAAKNQVQLSRKQNNLVNFWHPKSPDVILAQIKYVQAVQNDRSWLNRLFSLLITSDPQNWFYHGTYLEYLKQTGQDDLIALELKFLGDVFLDQKLSFQVSQIDFSHPVYKQVLFEKINLKTQDSPVNLKLAKLFYFTGVEFLKTDPAMTEKLFILSRDIAPTWGYFHMELAALEYYYLKDTHQAAKALEDCQKFEFAKIWCKEVSLDLTGIPKLGSLSGNILAIPQILK